MELLRQAFVRSSRRSASRNAVALRMSDRTVRRILHEDLNFHPYKMVMVQAINDQDMVNRKTLCDVLLNALDNDDLNHFLMTDEANFHLCGSSENCRYWATENPRDIHQKALHSEKVIVWCGVASFGVTGPYFFADEAGRAVTVNSARYTEVLRTFLEPELQRLGVETQTRWFQQDGATAHTTKTAVRVLNEMFPARVISRKGNIEWPARLPNLNACNFLLWGISQEQSVRKETKDNGGLETEHQGRSCNNFSHHAPKSDAELSKTLAGMCRQGTSPHRHFIQEVNIAIKML